MDVALRLSDGRQLMAADVGDPHGVPVLYVAGYGQARDLAAAPPADQAAAAQPGVAAMLAASQAEAWRQGTAGMFDHSRAVTLPWASPRPRWRCRPASGTAPRTQRSSLAWPNTSPR